RELNEKLENDARKKIGEMDWLPGERDGGEDGANDEKRETEIEGEDTNVKRKEDRADQLRAESEGAFVLRVAGRDLKRIATALEDFELVGFGQRTAEFGFLVFVFGTDVFRQFAQDV